jgi:hypothetical protein
MKCRVFISKVGVKAAQDVREGSDYFHQYMMHFLFFLGVLNISRNNSHSTHI